MLVAIALVYIALCVRIRVQLEAAFADGHGRTAISVGAYGLYLKRDYALVRGAQAFLLRFVPYKGGEKKHKKAPPASAFIGRFLRSYVLNALRSGRFDRLMIHLQLGLGDACETAIAAGAVHALVCALLAYTGNEKQCDLRIVPQFSGMCLRVHLQGMFSCQAGDILFSLLKAVLRKKKMKPDSRTGNQI